MLVYALLAAVPIADWIPVRWPSGDPGSLDRLAGSPINCLILEEPAWNAPFAAEARRRSLITLAIVRPPSSLAEASRKAAAATLDGLLLEGDFPAGADEALSGSTLLRVELPSRSRMRFRDVPIVGTHQGVWPGINATDDGTAKAAPSGAPWIDTNGGFLRYVRAATELPVWIANSPPPNTAISTERYLQVIGDSAIAGARWVLALEDRFWQSLFAGDARARRDWDRINQYLRYFEQHKHWRTWQPGGQMAVLQDPASGALLSGGILDMIAVKHTPVRPVPPAALRSGVLENATMAVNVDADALSSEQREALLGFRRRGGTVLTGPPGWKFPTPREGQITLDKESLDKLDAIWKELNTMTGRRNLGARLFNVSSMLSNLLVSADGKQRLLHLVNYADYPVEAITVHVPGSVRKARLLTPEKAPQELAVYPIEDGTGIDIDRVGVVATLLMEFEARDGTIKP